MKRMMWVLSAVLILGGCADWDEPPVPAADENSTAQQGETVTLDGSGSYDEDGDSLTYKWSIKTAPEGSLSEIADPEAAVTSFVPDTLGEYSIVLTVDDGEHANSTVIIVACLDGDYAAGEKIPVLVFFDATSIQGWVPEESTDYADDVLREEYPDLISQWEAGEIVETGIEVDPEDAFHPENFQVVGGQIERIAQ